MKTKAEQLEELKATAVKLQRQIWALEKPKQWEPRGGDYWGNLRHLGYGGKAKGVEVRLSHAMQAHTRLLAYVYEFGGDWEADWEDGKQEKCYVYYNYSGRRWTYSNWLETRISGAVYMSIECAKDLAFKLNSGEVIL